MNVIDYGQNSAQQGWQCPLCRVVWAPSVSSCSCTRQQTITTPNAVITPVGSGTATTTPVGWITTNSSTLSVAHIDPDDDDGLAGVPVPA